jgi:penicillin-binding protein 2
MSVPGIESRRPPLTPQLALRVAIVGGIALALFAIVFLRLWYLQVLTGDDLRREALDNRVRKVALAAPRGAIVDRNGREIVTNRVATVVQLDPRRIPAAHRDAALEWGRAMSERAAREAGSQGPPVPVPAPPESLRRRFATLGSVLGMSAASINERVVQQLAVTPYANIRVRVDVPQTMRNFLLERRAEFPGVTVQQVYLRRYREGSTAAQLVGTIGEINPDEIGSDRYRGVVQGTVVGKEGIERTYDSYLRGEPGVQSITIDAAGRPKSQRVARDPRPGDQLRTSLDLGLQQSAQRALARTIQGGKGTAGGVIALDPRNGEVLAAASYPTFRPSLLSRPISQARYDSIFGERNGSPKFNRAISGGYPTGSTFKPITALAALDRGLITPETPINDAGVLKVGTQEFRNARNAVHGTISLRRALQVSSDVFFYTLGRDANGLKGQAIQTWARRLGLGHTTGIDLPNEFGGTIPDRAWRARLKKREEACERRRKVASCGISDKRPWSLGDNINLSVGQGDVQATPLQMAVAYAAIGNGGKVVRPHVGVAVEDDGGRELQRIKVPAARRVKIDEGHRQAVLDGLRMSTVGDGTSAGVFSDWKHDAFPIYGKTGTAERPPRREDQSWYVAYAPHRGKPIVIAATVEDGGFGAESAAPIVCRMLASWFDQKSSCAASVVKE